MTNYEKAFKELYEAVQETDDQALRLEAINLRESLLNETEQQTQPKEQAPAVTKDDFKNMSYSERLQLKVKQPDVYRKLIG